MRFTCKVRFCAMFINIVEVVNFERSSDMYIIAVEINALLILGSCGSSRWPLIDTTT